MEHDVEVVVLSPESAQDGVAEFHSHGRMIGFTLLRDGELVLLLTAECSELQPMEVNAHSLMAALLHAKELLT
jgi:hypothetical protein